MKNEFNWKTHEHLGHKFNPIYNCKPNEGWQSCSICEIKVYIDNDYYTNQLMYWKDDAFHNEPNSHGVVVEFNLTCNEVLIKKIIE